ncbi:MAG: hypothetical protein KDD47_02785, partial [Acidobacteria bacterium]|nr:hypothetical protein [Acidobacteriota bacterium]
MTYRHFRNPDRKDWRRWAPRLLLGSFFFLAIWGYGTLQRPSFWDPAYYLAPAASLVVDGDLDLRNDMLSMETSPELLLRALCRTTATGRLQSDFPVGPGLFWAPVYFIGGLLDGSYLAEQPGQRWTSGPLLAIFLTALTVAAMVLLGLARWASKLGAGPPTSSLLAGGLFLGTPVGLYAVHLYTMAHALSALAVLGLLAASLRFAERPGPLAGLTMGAAFGAVVLLRWQDAVMGPIPLAAAMLAWKKEAAPRRGLGTLLALAAAAAMAAVQFSAWWQERGGIPWSPQGEGFMRWRHPQVLDLLFSGYSGVLPWAPMLLLGGLGLLLPWRCRLPQTWRWAFLLIFTAEIYLSAAAADWWGGLAYGPRRLSSLVPLAAVGLVNAALGLRKGVPCRLAVVAVLLAAAWGLVNMHLFLGGVRDLSVLVTGHPSASAAAVRDRFVQDHGTALEVLGSWLERWGPLPAEFAPGALPSAARAGLLGAAALGALVLAAWVFERVPRRLLEAGTAVAALVLALAVQPLILGESAGRAPEPGTWAGACAAAARGPSRCFFFNDT